MELQKAKKVVIVTEASLLNEIIQLAADLGTSGYTVSRVVGKGQTGSRLGNDLSGLLSNVKIEIVTSEEIARKLAAEVLTCFRHYAGIVYLMDAEVFQPKKFNLPG